MADFAGFCIAFDLDGTLIDTAPDLLRALNATLLEEGLAAMPLPQMRQFVGHGALSMIERAALAQGKAFGQPRLEALVERFVDHYQRDIAAGSRPFPGLVEALDALAAGGAMLSVCTNKRTSLSVQLLEALGLAPRFSAIVGADAVANKKPHPDHFREAVRRAGGAPERALMVGDTAADVGSAKAAGAPVIVVRFGYSPTPPDSLGADAALDDFRDLPALARRLLTAKPA